MLNSQETKRYYEYTLLEKKRDGTEVEDRERTLFHVLPQEAKTDRGLRDNDLLSGSYEAPASILGSIAEADPKPLAAATGGGGGGGGGGGSASPTQVPALRVATAGPPPPPPAPQPSSLRNGVPRRQVRTGPLITMHD